MRCLRVGPQSGKASDVATVGVTTQSRTAREVLVRAQGWSIRRCVWRWAGCRGRCGASRGINSAGGIHRAGRPAGWRQGGPPGAGAVVGARSWRPCRGCRACRSCGGVGAQLHAEALRIAPAECLFVDDDVRNVRGAIAIGMRAALIDRSRLERSRSADGTYYRYRQSHPLAHPF